jgi:hypothetical protein
LTIIHDDFWRFEDPAVHIYYHLVAESNIQTFKEIWELAFESFKKTIRDIILKIRWQLIVIVEFPNNQIIIINKSVLNCIFNGMV